MKGLLIVCLFWQVRGDADYQREEIEHNPAC